MTTIITPANHRHGWQPTPQVDCPSRFAHLKRSAKTAKICEQIYEETPWFFIANQTRSTDRRAFSLYKAAQRVTGRFLPFLAQQTGSCVGNGAWNAVGYTACQEIAKGDAEEYRTIFLPYHYGRGRMHAGIGGRGEGSTGSGQAKAILEDGVIEQTSDLPQHTGGENGLNWGASVEMQWSDGRRIDTRYIELGRKHLVKTVAPVRSYQQGRDAIANGYGVTVASNRGFRMQPVKDRGRWWGVPSGTWMHQMVFLAADDDPSRPGLHDLNSWGLRAHMPNSLMDQFDQFQLSLKAKGADGAALAGEALMDELGCPIGPGFWVDADVCDYMFRQNDSFAFSFFDGFPEQDTDLLLI